MAYYRFFYASRSRNFANGLVQSLIRRLGSNFKPLADRMMELLLAMFKSSTNLRNATLLEDALLAIGALTSGKVCTGAGLSRSLSGV